ncbi:MAG: efflux RND transporter permease subunit [Candidatus Wallbacteria bacterium]|nr:efflux RND transporter permease subunit [Candidatus Wallbacteria bacterium]
MNLSRFAVRNPHAVAVLALAILVVGAVTVSRIPVDLLPIFKTPAVQVLTLYPGMPAEVMEQDITTRLERWTGQANGIAWQEAKSLVGVSVVCDFFNEDVDPDTALAQVSTLAMSDLYYLPPGTVPPMVMPYDPTAALPLCLVTVSSPVFDETKLYDIAYYDLRNRLQSISGVVTPAVFGGKLRRILAYVDPWKLQSRNMSPMDVVRGIHQFNVLIPTGTARLGGLEYQVDSNAMVGAVSDLDKLPLRLDDSGPVFLSDVASAQDTAELQTNIVRIDGRRQVYIPVYRQPGANTISVVESIRDQLGLILERLPKGVDLRIDMDQTVFVRSAIRALEHEALLGALLAALMVLLFLRSGRSMVFILLTLPLSILAALIGLYFTGGSINTMTLGGLALAVGMLMDNGIVVLENSMRHLERGCSPAEAAVRGAGELAGPVFVATVTIVVVFSPVVFLTGLGRFLFTPLALAVVFSMAASYVLSMTVIPACVARFFPGSPAQRGDGHSKPATGALERLYGRVIDTCLARPMGIVGLSAALFAASWLLYPAIGQELFPSVDSGQFTVLLRAPSGTELKRTEELVKQAEAKLREILPPGELVTMISNIGVFNDWPAAYTPNTGGSDAFIAIQLSPHRAHSSQYWAARLRDELPPVLPGVEFAFDTGGLMTAALNFGLPSPIDIQIEGKNLREGRKVAERLVARIRPIAGAVDVRIQQRLDFPLLRLEVDRVKAATLGLTQEDVVQNVATALNSSVSFAKSFWIDHKNGNHYFVGAQYPEHLIRDFSSLEQIPIVSARTTQPVVLKDVAALTLDTTTNEVRHRNITRVIDVFVNVQGRDVGSVAREIDAILADESSRLPEGLRLRSAGEVRQMKESFGGLALGLLLALVLVYLVMVVQFRSFVDPLVVLLTVPMGFSGVLAMLFLSGTTLNIQSLLGVIAMIGLAASYNILLVDLANQLWRAGAHREAAIKEACLVRLRPIVMTSLAAILGLVPMAMAQGQAAMPLARAMIGGLLGAKLMTLVLTPALYRLLKPKLSPEAPDELV